MHVHEPVFQHRVGRLYQDHHRWLRGWLASRLDNSHLAADLAQDVFLRILSKDDDAGRLSAIREPRSYLATIARRLMIDHFRRNRLERAWQQALAEQPEAEGISEESRAILLETLYELDAMLSGLGHVVRQAFLLSQLEGLPQRVIAERLGIAPITVHRHIAKAVHQCLLYQLRHAQ